MLNQPPTVIKIERADGGTFEVSEFEQRGKLAGERDEFKYHKVTPECAAELASIRRAFRFVRDKLERTIPPCRLRSIAITHLGDASRAAIAAAVLSDPGSVAEEG